MGARWFGFHADGEHVGWQQLVRRSVEGPAGSLVRREGLTVFRAGEHLQVSGFFVESPEGDPLAWHRFGTLRHVRERYVEDAVHVRHGDQLQLAGGGELALPALAYPGQLLLELAHSMLRAGRAELFATPLNDSDGSLEPPVHLRLRSAASGPPGVTHQLDELPVDGGLARRSVLLAPDGRPERQVWGPGAWCGPPMPRALARAAGPDGIPALV